MTLDRLNKMCLSIDVLQCTHGNEYLGRVLDRHFKHSPKPGIRSRIAHPEAMRLGVRCLGITQLQAHYPGNRYGDPEDRAAYRNMLWLGKHVGDAKTLIYDVHNSTVPGLTAFSVGKRALKATMVGAWQSGYNKCYYISDPFRGAVPNVAVLENSVFEEDFSVVAKRLHTNLGNLALMDVSDLASRYEEMVANVEFFTWHGIRTTSEEGTMQPFIPNLEAVPGGEAFTPLNLSSEQRMALGISDDVGEVLIETWGYQNMSEAAPNLGHTDDGVPRRAYFGGYFLPAQAPIANGEWALLDNMSRA
jgi:hypothetical protein